MMRISRVDFSSGVGAEEYQQKSQANVHLFQTIFGAPPSSLRNSRFECPEENRTLIQRVSELSSLDTAVVEGINNADEYLDMNLMQGLLGCTSVGRDGKIGQTLDLFAVELSLVRDGDAVYITMPPYLTLMGMNEHLAFCTNYIGGGVRDGVPVAHVRRTILRQTSLEGVVDYLKSIKRTTPVNFLLSDGVRMIDVESAPDEVRVHSPVEKNGGAYIAHTNHLIVSGFTRDHQCSRLTRAVDLLNSGKDVKEVLDDPHIRMPVLSYDGIGFGSIVHVVMDVKAKRLEYRDTTMHDYMHET